jgi:hypothetical protein
VRPKKKRKNERKKKARKRDNDKETEKETSETQKRIIKASTNAKEKRDRRLTWLELIVEPRGVIMALPGEPIRLREDRASNSCTEKPA